MGLLLCATATAAATVVVVVVMCECHSCDSQYKTGKVFATGGGCGNKKAMSMDAVVVVVVVDSISVFDASAIINLLEGSHTIAGRSIQGGGSTTVMANENCRELQLVGNTNTTNNNKNTTVPFFPLKALDVGVQQSDSPYMQLGNWKTLET